MSLHALLTPNSLNSDCALSETVNLLAFQATTQQPGRAASFLVFIVDCGRKYNMSSQCCALCAIPLSLLVSD